MKLSKTLFVVKLIFISAFFVSCNKEDEDAIEMDIVKKGVEYIAGSDGREFEAVDLGLPSKLLWATCNIGANSPQEAGDYYAWGETSTKSIYLWPYYKHCVDDITNLKKYITSSGQDYLAAGYSIDNKTRLDSIDDVAIVTMGGKWRIPTSINFNELDRNTQKRFCILKGVPGILFTSTRRGYEDRCIFLPIAGKYDDKAISFSGRSGWYWASELSSEKCYMGQEFNIDNNANSVLSQYPRYVGLSVRPVTKR